MREIRWRVSSEWWRLWLSPCWSWLSLRIQGGRCVTGCVTGQVTQRHHARDNNITSQHSGTSHITHCTKQSALSSRWHPGVREVKGPELVPGSHHYTLFVCPLEPGDDECGLHSTRGLESLRWLLITTLALGWCQHPPLDHRRHLGRHPPHVSVSHPHYLPPN